MVTLKREIKSQEDIFPEDYNSYNGGQTFGFSYWTVLL